MPEPVDRKNPITNDEMRTASTDEHPDREQARKEKADRVRRDREELGRPGPEQRERAQLEGVTDRRDREAAEEADRIERRDD